MNTRRFHSLVVLCILSILFTQAASPRGLAFIRSPGDRQDSAPGLASSFIPSGWTKQELPGEQAAQRAHNIAPAGQFGGNMSPFIVQNNTLYAAVGSWLVIQDITNPATPVAISRTLVTSKFSTGLTVSGNYAFVADGELDVGYELNIINIYNPTKPYKVGSYTLDCSFGSLVVAGNYAYISTEDVYRSWGYDCRGSLDIVDISNPARPVEVGSLSNEDKVPLGLAVVENCTYLAYRASGSGGLQIIDISDPSNPVEVSSYEISVSDFKVSGHYAYITNEEGLRILDISSPTKPVEVGSFNVSQGLETVVVAGNYAFVAEVNDTEEEGNLHIVDISNPANPVEVSLYEFSGYDPEVAVERHYVFIAAAPCRFYILDISNPAQPVKVDFSFGPPCVEKVELAGSFAYTIDGSGRLSIVDISHPANQKEVGYANLSRVTSRLAVSGNYAYVAGDGLHILDVSNHTKPIEVGSLSYPDVSPRALAIEGHYAYLVASETGLYIIDISSPSNPSQAGFYSGTFDDMDLAGNYAYIKDHGSLRILDLSSSPNPVEVGSITISEYSGFGSVVVAGNIAYITNASSQIYIIDVSNPTAPTEVGSYDLLDPGNAYPMAVSGNYLYVEFSEPWDPRHPSGPGSLHILDISDPIDPGEVGFYKPSYASDVEVAGNYIYAANGNYGLLVLTYLPYRWYLPMVSISK